MSHLRAALASVRKEDGNSCVEYLFLLTSVIFGATLGLNAVGGFVSSVFTGLSVRLGSVIG
jgi:hypothetical protein